MTNLNGNVKENGHGLSPWPPAELQRLTGDELPFDEAAEVQLALDTCQELDDDALEQLANLPIEGEALAAVEQLVYSAAIRRHYLARLRTRQRSFQAETSVVVD